MRSSLVPEFRSSGGRNSVWVLGAFALLPNACMAAAAPEPEAPRACPKQEPPAARATLDDVIPALPPREPLPPALPGHEYPPPDLEADPPVEAVLAAANAPAAPAADVIAALPVPDVAPAFGAPILTTKAGHGLLAIDPQVRPFKVSVPQTYVACGTEYVAQVRICVTASGEVADVSILKPSIPVIDLQIPNVIHRWRYYSYLVDGRPTPFCYAMNYRIR
jgi:hypothetical protein